MPRSDWKPTIADLIALTGLFSIAGAGLSLLYDWAYLNELGLSLSTIPYGSEDLAHGVIHWLIPLVFSIVAGYLMNASDSARIVPPGGKPTPPPVSFEKFMEVLIMWPMLVLFGLIWLIMLLKGAVPRHTSLPTVLALIIWLLVGPRLLFKGFKGVTFVGFQKVWVLGAYLLVALGLYIIIQAKGEVAFETGKPLDYRIGQSDGCVLKCRIIRHFSGFYLVQLGAEESYRFIPNQEVRYIEQKATERLSWPWVRLQ